ncbi:hypothetical protein J2Z48_002341 [Croceifilum oryzae]|uniref:Uncharacterized protein n=1 Tax=Croceifilum oryzae TaxID=1553429 RepID=A0AAJ1WR39_9BACL|nr:hypothetical protein [Croceifilum oryzae]MDQ0418152.1 hypothetical protein [Croceifilum oryzae]
MRKCDVKLVEDHDGEFWKAKIKVDGVIKRTLYMGNKYIIKPRNPLTKRNRDRIVTIRKFVPDNYDKNIQAYVSVKFLDNNSVGRAKFCELEEIAPNSTSDID